MSAKPLGKRAFSLLFASKAPYFRTVRPQVRDVRPHHAELSIRKRRAVQNHIGTLHAIAVCNGLEAAMGLLAEATTPKDRRWIPKGMQVAYLAKSTTDLLCVAETEPAEQFAEEATSTRRARRERDRSASGGLEEEPRDLGGEDVFERREKDCLQGIAHALPTVRPHSTDRVDRAFGLGLEVVECLLILVEDYLVRLDRRVLQRRINVSAGSEAKILLALLVSRFHEAVFFVFSGALTKGLAFSFPLDVQ